MTQIRRFLGYCAFPLVFTPCALAQYQYYYSDSFSTVNTSNWYVNGSLTTGSSGLTSSSTGAVISKVAVPDGSSFYEVKMTLALTANGGKYYSYLRATSNTDADAGTGTYYAIVISNPVFSGGNCTATLIVDRANSGSITQLYYHYGTLP